MINDISRNGNVDIYSSIRSCDQDRGRPGQVPHLTWLGWVGERTSIKHMQCIITSSPHLPHLVEDLLDDCTTSLSPSLVSTSEDSFPLGDCSYRSPCDVTSSSLSLTSFSLIVASILARVRSKRAAISPSSPCN